MARRALNADGSLSEAAWQSRVEGYARFFGWRLFHAPDNKPRGGERGRAGRQRVEAGFPDLVLVRPPELIFAELKAELGRISPAQAEWLADLRHVADAIAEWVVVRRDDTPAVEVYVWRPADEQDVVDRLGRGRPTIQI